jgi:hypothetical protein
MREDDLRVVLDQMDFSDLVHGREVRKFTKDREGNEHWVRLILSDIGFGVMVDEVLDAMKR